MNTLMPTNTALQAWQEQVTACRNARLETEDQSWQQLAAWYEGWVRHNDYVQLTLPRLAPFIHAEARILEIGPGTGAFTLPFARAARQVVAAEPSPEMCAILKKNPSSNIFCGFHETPEQDVEMSKLCSQFG
jgi:predicted O-methyltransferase YrrM